MQDAEWDQLLQPLDERERQVLKLRLGADRGSIPRKLGEVADLLEMDPILVADIESEAMQKLRDLES